MRNWNIGGTNRYFFKKIVVPAFFSSTGCYAQCGQQLIHTKPGFCWFAIACRLPPWTHWHGEHLGLRSLKRWIACSCSSWAQWQASRWLQWKWDRVPLFWKGDPAVLELFWAHAALKVCSFRAFQIFSHLLDSMTTQQHHEAPSTERRVYQQTWGFLQVRRSWWAAIAIVLFRWVTKLPLDLFYNKPRIF